MKILTVFVLIVYSIGLWSERSQASSLPDTGHFSFLPASLHNNRPTPSDTPGQSLRSTLNFKRRVLSRRSTNESLGISRLNRRGACIGKHPCQQDNTPPQSPRHTPTQSPDRLHGSAFHAPGSVSSFGTPSRYLTPPDRSPERPQVKSRPQLGSGAPTRNAFYTSSSSDFPSPPSGSPARISTPVRLEHIKSRPLIGLGGPNRNVVQAPSWPRDRSPSLDRVRYPERASSTSTQHSQATIGDIIPDVHARAHGTLSRFYSNISRSSSLDGPAGLAKRARWDQLHKVHRASSEHYYQMSRVMKSSAADLLPMEN